MKITFQVIKSGSGNDVYFERLAESLNKVNIDTEIFYYHKYFQFFPILLKFFNKKSNGDIIHSNVEYGWVFKEKNKPLYVSLLHNVFEKGYKQYTSLPQRMFHYLVLKPNIAKSLKIADKSIAISKYTKESFEKEFQAEDIEVVYCGIDTDKYKPLRVKSTDKRFKLLFVGNLTKRKGADLLPKIMEKLGSDYVLYYTSGLRTKPPQEFNLPNMLPLGRLSEEELIQEYNKCDALIFPTRLEGFGYCVAEAMACGKPVISTNISSIPEIIEDEIGETLCNRDDVNCFINKIRGLDDTNTRKFNSRRQNITSKFSLNIIAKEYEKIYLQQ